MYIVSVRTAVAINAYLDFYKSWKEAKEFYQIQFVETDFFSIVDACSRSEANIGIMVYFTGQRDYIESYISLRNLELFDLDSLPTYITLSQKNPALKRGVLDLSRIQDMPCATYSDYMDSILNIANECKLIGIAMPKKLIYVHDRHALFKTLSCTDAYAISARYSDEDCRQYKLISVPIENCALKVHFGYLKLRDFTFRDDSMEMQFINTLKQVIDTFKCT